MNVQRKLSIVSLSFAIGVAACGGNGRGQSGESDASARDSAAGDDASMMMDDAGETPDADVPMDAELAVDSSSSMDAAATDSSLVRSLADQLQRIRTEAPGTPSEPIRLVNATVTYVRAASGTDPAGFFIQAGTTGPAVFIAIDASTLTPPPVAGDTVSFDVVETARVAAQSRVTMLENFERTGSGVDLSSWAADLSTNSDITSVLETYESELVKITGTIATPFSDCGSPHRCAQITTAGFTTAGSSLRIRILDSVETVHSLVEGCTLTVGPTPLWRFNMTAQPSAWLDAEVTGVSCPTPITLATVVVNEVNANVADACDLIELRVLSAGSMGGLFLRERNTGVVVSFPMGFHVEANDIIVVHLNSPNAACNPDGATNETASVNALPASSYAGNYDTAFDFWSLDTGITATDNVIAILNEAGDIVDAVLLADSATGTAAAASESAAASVVTAGQWLEGGGAPLVDDVFRMNAVLDLDATGTSASGESIQRSTNTDSNTKTGWTQTASSFGARNAGQTAL